MPIPQPNQNEDNERFIARCMSNEAMKKDYPDSKQRIAICLGQTKKTKSSILENLATVFGFISQLDCEECGSVEELSLSNIVIPKNEDYIDAGEETEEYDIYAFFYNTSHIEGSEYQGRKVTLNKPFRTPDAKKKFAVYVRNKEGKVIIVRFGSQEMSIKRDDPARRKSFRARHKCDQQKDKTRPAYWSCFQWRSNSPVQD